MAKCSLCRKSLFQCRCHEAPTHSKVRKGKRVIGTQDTNGVVWCSKCSCRVISQRCTNFTCSSHSD